MSGSGKNNRGETDSIKEMLERLRRSVTDLPPEPEENVQEVQPSSTTEEPIVEEAGQTPIAEIVAERSIILSRGRQFFLIKKA